MDHKERYKRLRLLTKNLNRERKKQAKKIDILCNDLIAAQRGFIKKLDTISFEANFYEAIVGANELGKLFCAAGKLIKDEVPDASVAFFLRQREGFELHMFESDEPITMGKQQLENCFTGELVESICKSNKICTLDDMFSMGLECSPMGASNLSAATIPVGRMGRSLGFILIYRRAKGGLITEELGKITAVTPGLSRAIQSCRELSHAGD